MSVFRPVPNQPHVQYRTFRDVVGQFWIECTCQLCGPGALWRKACLRPSLTMDRVGQYAQIHQHAERRARA